MGDRHRRAASAPHNFHMSVSLVASTAITIVPTPARGLSESNWPSGAPIPGNRKSPACFSRLIGNDNQARALVADERMLERIDSVTMRPMLTA
jgi:hypothetical protein